jgi:hypothetical protein
MTIRLHGVGLAALIALTCFGRLASADISKAQCANANGDAQTLRRAGKFAEARVQLQACSDPKCPAIVADDCTKRLNELEMAQPTIIFDVRDPQGHDLSAVAVTIDGHPLATALDGRPLPVDPGEHTFVFTLHDEPPVTQTFVLKENEQARHERIVIGTPPPPAEAAPPAPATGPSVEAPPPERDEHRTTKILGISLGAVGLGGIVVGSVFGLQAASAANKQKSECGSPTQCTDRTDAAAEHSTGSTDATISTIAFIAGGALIATGAVLFLTANHHGSQTTAARLVVAPTVEQSGGGVLLRGAF